MFNGDALWKLFPFNDKLTDYPKWVSVNLVMSAGNWFVGNGSKLFIKKKKTNK